MSDPVSNAWQTLEDAERYVELARAAWVDPEVVVLDLLADVLDAHETVTADAVDDVRLELNEAHEKAIAELREELDVDKQDVPRLMEALKIAIERERLAAIAMRDEQNTERSEARDAKLTAQDDELALLRAEVRTLKERNQFVVRALTEAPTEPEPNDSPPAPKRKHRGVSPPK